MSDPREPSRALSVVLLLLVVSVAGLAYPVLGGPPPCTPSRERRARDDAGALRAAGLVFVLERHACPEPAQLVTEGYLDGSRPLLDPWGRPHRIRCMGQDVEVVSAGPNGRFGDEDDVGPSTLPWPLPQAGGELTRGIRPLHERTKRPLDRLRLGG